MRDRYNAKGWPLTLCVRCAWYRYTEPHGTFEFCRRCDAWTESVGVPYDYGDTVVRMTPAQRSAVVAKAKERGCGSASWRVSVAVRKPQ